MAPIGATPTVPAGFPGGMPPGFPPGYPPHGFFPRYLSLTPYPDQLLFPPPFPLMALLTRRGSVWLGPFCCHRGMPPGMPPPGMPPGMGWPPHHHPQQGAWQRPGAAIAGAVPRPMFAAGIGSANPSTFGGGVGALCAYVRSHSSVTFIGCCPTAATLLLCSTNQCLQLPPEQVQLVQLAQPPLHLQHKQLPLC